MMAMHSVVTPWSWRTALTNWTYAVGDMLLVNAYAVDADG